MHLAENAINNKIHRYYQTGIIPYCSGQWSRTTIMKKNEFKFDVLILIVMEDGLVRKILKCQQAKS